MMKTIMQIMSSAKPQTKQSDLGPEKTQRDQAVTSIQQLQMDKAYQFARLSVGDRKNKQLCDFAEAS